MWYWQHFLWPVIQGLRDWKTGSLSGQPSGTFSIFNCCFWIINHVTEAGSHGAPLTSDSTSDTNKPSQPACHKTNVFLFVTKNTTAIRTWSVLLWTAPAWLFWYFNKYQAQTRLGSSSLRNVSEGSAITHNKWAYANSGVFAMHKSLFGVLHSDAVCWYAIILKSIKVQVWVYRLTGAVGDALSSYRLPLEYSMNKEGKKIVTIRGSLGVW